MKTVIAEPERIALLPHDGRGYPIPWNVLRGTDGAPFFIINDDRKAFQALRAKLCPICGERLGRWKWFVGGLRSAFSTPLAVTSSLPGHRECMEYALQVCPYLAIPKYLRCADAIAHPEKLPVGHGILLNETVIPERPEVMVAVCASKIELLDRGPLQPYLKPVQPFDDWTYWRHGERINETQALPYLRAALGADWTPPGRAE